MSFNIIYPEHLQDIKYKFLLALFCTDLSHISKKKNYLSVVDVSCTKLILSLKKRYYESFKLMYRNFCDGRIHQQDFQAETISSSTVSTKRHRYC